MAKIDITLKEAYLTYSNDKYKSIRAATDTYKISKNKLYR